MKQITMLELRRETQAILENLQRGQSFKLTYRGKEIAYITPTPPADQPSEDDPIYRLHELSEKVKAKSISNKEIDDIVYGV